MSLHNKQNHCNGNSTLEERPYIKDKTAPNEVSCTLFHQNIEHLKSRIEPLEITLDELKPAIIILTEHAMKACEIDRLSIKNYTVNSCYARERSTKGGVVILSDNVLKHKQVVIPTFITKHILQDKQFEACMTCYIISNIKLLVMGIYRSPTSNLDIFLERLSIMVDYLSKKFNNIVIGGDFNINVLKKDSDFNKFEDTIKGLNMAYLVDFPTRIGKTSKTAIDNFLVNSPTSLKISVEGVITCLSDHDGQIMKIENIKTQNAVGKPVKKQMRKFSRKNICAFKLLLQKETWESVYAATVDSKYDAFITKFVLLFDQTFPKCTVSTSNRKKQWITDELKYERKEIIRLTNKMRENTLPALKNVLKLKKNKFRIKINKTKTTYYENKIRKSPNIQKTVWEIINNEVGGKNNRSKVRDITLINENRHVSDPYVVSEVFNDYFANVVKDISSNFPYVSDGDQNDVAFQHQFRLEPVNRGDVEEVIESLNRKYSFGYDEIPVSLIKDIKFEISNVLCHLINSSFVSRIFPRKLKISKIIPIYKKNDPKMKENYRPVTLLPTFSKIYEKIVFNQLASYLLKFRKLESFQHGFRPGRSVVSAAVQFVESVIESIDRGEFVSGIFLDLTRAFDSVKYSILLNKLQDLGISLNCLEWFRSYLSDRYQYVEITHVTKSNHLSRTKSTLQPIKFGVPQGSILGPLLFLCYLTDIGKTLLYSPRSQLCLYADDSNLKISSMSLEEIELISYIELENVNNFFKKHNLAINENKTKIVTFKTEQDKKSENLSIKFNNYNIENETHINFLGMKLDQNLNWNEHVNKILKKIHSGIYALSKMAFVCNTKTLKMIYFAYIHSHISFGICLFGSASQCKMNKILVLQKKALRIILNLKYNDSVKEHFSRLKILTVYGQYILDTVMIVRGETDTPIKDAPVHSYNTRGKREIVKEHHRLKFFEKKPTYIGNLFLRHLPKRFKEEKNIKKFKKQIKEYLIENPLYSLDEFFHLSLRMGD